MQSTQLDLPAVAGLIAREAKRYTNIRAVQLTNPGEKVDILFVVEDDLGGGEPSAFRILDALVAKFSDLTYDFLVLPARLHSPDFMWREHAASVYERE